MNLYPVDNVRAHMDIGHEASYCRQEGRPEWGLSERWFQIQGIKDCCCGDHLSRMDEESAIEVCLTDQS